MRYFETWAMFGAPCRIEGGGMSAPVLVDLRSTLYTARVAWLERQDLDAGEVEAYERLWSSLDRERLDHDRRIVESALKKLNRAGK